MANIVIGAAGVVMAVLTYCVGRLATAKKEGKESGSLVTDIKYIKESVSRIDRQLNDDVKRLEGRIDEQSNMMLSLSDVAARAQEAAKSAHKRLDEHLEREHGQTVIHR